jgi:hypothetical protein
MQNYRKQTMLGVLLGMLMAGLLASLPGFSQGNASGALQGWSLSLGGTAVTALQATGAPAAAATTSLVQFGPTAIAAGVAGGTFLGINTAGAFDPYEYEVSGVQKFNINNAGQINMGNSVAGTGNALNHANIVLTTANVTGMNGTAVTLITGTASKTLIIASPVSLRYTKVTTDFSNGGAIVIQYHTGTKAATGTLAAAQLLSGSTENVVVPVAQTSMTAGDNLEITNATGAFTAGGTSTLTVMFDYYLQ